MNVEESWFVSATLIVNGTIGMNHSCAADGKWFPQEAPVWHSLCSVPIPDANGMLKSVCGVVSTHCLNNGHGQGSRDSTIGAIFQSLQSLDPYRSVPRL